MQLDFAFLSQLADFVVSDDKLAAWGIGIDGLESSTMPFQASPMSLVAKILLLPDESDEGHTYSVTVINPEGEEAINQPIKVIVVEEDRQQEIDRLRAENQAEFDKIEEEMPDLDELLSICTEPPREWLDERWS